MAAYGRFGDDASGWILSRNGTREGHDYSGWREYLSARGGGVFVYASQGGGRTGDWSSGCEAGRNGGGVDSGERAVHGGGGSGALPGEDCTFQDPAVHSLCGCVSDDGDREDSEVQDAGG